MANKRGMVFQNFFDALTKVLPSSPKADYIHFLNETSDPIPDINC